MKRMILTGLLAIGAGAMCLIGAGRPAQRPRLSQRQLPRVPHPNPRAKSKRSRPCRRPGADPDKAIAAAENLITKFADTDFKAIALYIEADAYERKGDFNRMQIFAERALEADPRDFRAALMLAKHFAIHTGPNDLDREEKLGKGEKYAHHGHRHDEDSAQAQPRHHRRAVGRGAKGFHRRSL